MYQGLLPKSEKESVLTALHSDVESISDNDLLNDKDLLLLEKELLALFKPALAESTIAQRAIVYGLGELHCIDLKQAYEILSLDEEGKDRRTNVYGKNPVKRLGNVFFKRILDYDFLGEQAVYQMSRLLGGGLVTPTRLLIVELPIQGKMDKIAVQASLTVGKKEDKTLEKGDIKGIEEEKKGDEENKLVEKGVGLDSLLMLPATMTALRKIFGKDDVSKVLQELLNENYYQEFMRKNSYSEDLSWKEQRNILLDRLYQLPGEDQPLDLRRGGPTREQVEIALNEDRGLRSSSLFPLIALIERFPMLCKNQLLGDIFFLPESFRLINQLYPNQTSDQIISQIDNLYSHFNSENVSRHLLLALLTEPGDHVGDNFVVKIKRDNDGRLFPFEIIAIDNDHALNGTIKLSKTNHYHMQVITIIFGLIHFMNQPLDEKVRRFILSLNPDLFLLQWLHNLDHIYQDCLLLLQKGIISEVFFKDLNLHKLLPSDFVTRMLSVLQNVQRTLANRNLGFQDFLLEAEPILGHYYRALMRVYQNPHSLLLALRDGKDNVKNRILEGCLEDKLTNGEIFGERIQKICRRENSSFESYWQVLVEWIQARKLLEPDNKLQDEVLRLLMNLSRFPDRSIMMDELIIPIETFAKLGTKFPQFIPFLKGIKRIALQFKDKLYSRVLITDPDILFKVLMIIHASNDKDIQNCGKTWIQGLITYGISPIVQRKSDGYTLLHLAAALGLSDYVPLFIQSGVDFNVVDKKEDNVLDVAIQCRSIEVIQELILAGAGNPLKLENGVSCFELYSKRHAELCQQLVNRNIELAWHLALKFMTDDKENNEQILIDGIKGKRYLRAEVCVQIFKAGEIPRENFFGKHNVKPIALNIVPGISLGMHLKEKPEYFGREFMVHTLARRLFGFITPAIALFRFCKMEGMFSLFAVPVGYPVLASYTIPGLTLLEALEQPDLQIDKQSYDEAVILAMLTNPEDGRGDNYILMGDRIISIDNDRAFVRPVVVKDNGEEVLGPEGLQVKTILYCMDLMKKPLHPKVRERILNLNPYELLTEWLRALHNEQDKIQKLFSKEERRELAKKNIDLNILFKPSVIADIYQKIKRLQNTLKRHPDMNLLEILERVIPELGFRYSAAFKNHHSAQSRYEFLTKGCFEVQQVKVKDTTIDYHKSRKMTTSKMMELTSNKQLEAKLLKEEQAATWEVALARLEEIEKQYKELKEIQAELLQGRKEKFRRLIPDQQEMVVNGRGAELSGIDFSTIKKPDGASDVKRQLEILRIMRKAPFRKLRILNFEALTDEILSAFLRPMKDLLILEIFGCSQLTDKVLLEISSHCPRLQKLRLARLPLLQNGINFPELRVLKVQDCPSLKEWSHQGVRIEKIEFQACPQLAQIRIASSINVRRVILKDSVVSHSGFYERYPQLMQVYLEGLPDNFVQALDTMLENRIYTRTGNKMPPFAVDRLTEMIEFWRSSVRKIIPKLLARLEDEDFHIRIAAAEALGKLSPSLEKLNVVLDILLPLLKRSSFVKRDAAYALGNLSFPPEMLKVVLYALLPLLQDEDLFVKKAAAEALGKLSPTSMMLEVALNFFLPFLNNVISEVRSIAAETLGNLSFPPKILKDVLHALLPLLQDEDLFVKKAAAEALGKLSPTSEMLRIVVDALLLLLKDENIYVNGAAAKALGNLSIPPEMLKIVLNVLHLKTEHPHVRSAAAEALAKLSPSPEMLKFVIDIFLPFLKDKNLLVRRDACETLGKLPNAFESIKIIIESLFLELNKMRSLLSELDKYITSVVFFGEDEDSVTYKNYVTSVLTSVAELCQVDRYLTCFATWFENTFPKISQDPLQTSSSISGSANLFSLSEITFSVGDVKSVSPGDAKSNTETNMLQQYALAASQQHYGSRILPVASQKNVQKP